MTAISAAAMRCRTMADGSLRIEVEVEPKDAQTAFAMFGKPGAPMALAALHAGYAAAGAEPGDDKLKGGPLSKLAGQWCEMPEFHEWMKRAFPFLWSEVTNYNSSWSPSQVSAEIIRVHCSVESRRLLDHDERAADQFHSAIRAPFAEELQRRARG